MTKKTEMTKTKEQIAVHQAGQAIVASSVGEAVSEVSVDCHSESKYAGYCLAYGSRLTEMPSEDKDAIPVVMMAMAGALAVERLVDTPGPQDRSHEHLIDALRDFVATYPNPPRRCHGKDYRDFRMAANSLNHAYPHMRMGFFRKLMRVLFDETDRLLGENIDEVRLLADELLEHDTLNGQMLDGLAPPEVDIGRA